MWKAVGRVTLNVAERFEKQQKVLKAIQVAYNDILDRHNKLKEILAPESKFEPNNNTLNITNAVKFTKGS